MTSAGPHRLILASAGTGKTFQLTGRFLQILLDGVAPERILATTFTRKAAGEILDRVLRRLTDAAQDDARRAQLAEQLGRPLTAADVRERLVALVSSFDRFRVRTLDAFFVQLGRLFALDLGLPPEWTIVEDAFDRELRREALAHALEAPDADPSELLGILRDLQQADLSSSVERVLLARVELGRDAFLDSDEAAWRALRVPPGPAAQELAWAVQTLGTLPVPATAKGTPNKYWTSARDKIAASVAAGDWEKLLESGLVKNLLNGDDEFARQPIDGAWRDVLETLVLEVRHRLLAQLDRENRAAWRWLARFERSYEARKRERRAYRFEDLPKALQPRDASRAVSQDLVWYRLDARIDHLLLDEFQDTAPVQWRLLSNLADEILADGTGARSFFCVGDVKQSIYGWRSAEPRLLEEMGGLYPVLRPESMSASRRSSRVVLDTVARVFGTIGSSPVLLERPASASAGAAFQEAFETPAAALDLPGAAWLLVAPPESAAAEDEGEDDERADDAPASAEGQVLRLAAERTRAMLAEAPLATVGILLRRNQWVPRLIRLLREHGVRASGEGGNPLSDSIAVLHVLSLLHLADHPGDTAAAFHVATSPLAPLAGLTPAGFREEAAEAAAVTRRRLAVEGHGRWCASFASAVDEGYGAWDRKRFEQLVDLAYAFEDAADLRADRFVDHVRLTPVEDPSATHVQVMTVHAAKGLEFDAVVLPELDGALELRKSALLTRRPRASGPFDAVSHSRGSALAALDPDGLGALAAHQEERATREALCLLYVAMTRARYRLDLIVKHRKDPTRSGKTFAGILREALAPGRGPDEHGVLWRHEGSCEPWHPAHLRAAGAPPAFAAPRAPRFRDVPAPALVRRTPSAQEGAGMLEPAELLRSPAAETRLRGQLVHRFLQEVEWLEGFDASDAALAALARPLRAPRALVERSLRELRAALARPRLGELLGRAAHERRAAGAELRVWRERAFAVLLPGAEGHEELWSGAFDRVVLAVRDGRVVSAELVDFKTDRVEPDDVAERAAYYRPQLEGYRRVLARMCGLEPASIRALLAFVQADLIVEP